VHQHWHGGGLDGPPQPYFGITGNGHYTGGRDIGYFCGRRAVVMAAPTIDETFNDLVAINKIVAVSLHELGKVRGKNNPLTEGDLRKLVLTTSKAILCRLPCLRLGDDAIQEMNSKYSNLLVKMQAI
jgi:hypothetical protein